MLPGALAAAAHHQQVAVSEGVGDRGPAAPWTEQEPARRGWNPADDLYEDKVVDKDLDLDGGKFSTPPPRRG